MLGNFRAETGCKGRTNPKCMKKQEAATVSMEQKKNSREKCQQQIAAGSCCHRQCGLQFPHVSLLPHYASSFHPIKHKYRQQNNSGSILVLFALGEIKSRAKQCKMCHWKNERGKKDGSRSNKRTIWLCVWIALLKDLVADNPFASFTGQPVSPVFLWVCGGQQFTVLILQHEQTAVQLI